MKIRSHNELGLVLFVFIYCLGAIAQDKPLDSLLSAFKSPDPAVRVDAFEQVKRNREALERSDVRAALVDLLDRENRLIHETLLESDGGQGVAIKYGEDYALYTTELDQSVIEIVDWGNARSACILAESSDDPDSSFIELFVSKGGARLVPCLLQLARGNRYGMQDSGEVLAMDRANTIPILLGIECTSKDLTSAEAKQIDDIMDQGLRDPSGQVRRSIVEGWGQYGSPVLIPRLQEISRSDAVNFVRKAAMQAIQSIEERSRTRTQ